MMSDICSGLFLPSTLVFSGSWNSEDGAKAHMFMILSSPQGYATKRRSGADHSTKAPGVSMETRSVLGSAKRVSFDTSQRIQDFPTAYGWTSPTIFFRVKDCDESQCSVPRLWTKFQLT
jgi:hypothetical protein